MTKFTGGKRTLITALLTLAVGACAGSEASRQTSPQEPYQDDAIAPQESVLPPEPFPETEAPPEEPAEEEGPAFIIIPLGPEPGEEREPGMPEEEVIPGVPAEEEPQEGEQVERFLIIPAPQEEDAEMFPREEGEDAAPDEIMKPQDPREQEFGGRADEAEREDADEGSPLTDEPRTPSPLQDETQERDDELQLDVVPEGDPATAETEPQIELIIIPMPEGALDDAPLSEEPEFQDEESPEAPGEPAEEMTL